MLSLEVLREPRRRRLTAAWERAVRADVAGWISPLLAATTVELLAVWRHSEALHQLRRSYRSHPHRDIDIDVGGCAGRDGGGELLALLRRYREVALDPYWPSILAHLEADQARRGRIVVQHGVGHMLALLHPRVRWRPPFLDVAVAPGRAGGGGQAVVLGGSSVALVPSVFCLDRPRILLATADGRSPCLIVYPALRSVEDAVWVWAGERPPNRPALAALLGRTRARALDAIATTCSTTELAHRIGVSPATASHHAAALRSAGLVVSSRIGIAISHRLTALGVALLGRPHTPDAGLTRQVVTSC